MDSPEYDDSNYRKLEEIPEKCNQDQREIAFKVTVHRNDATWVSSRIFEDVDRDLISAKIEVKSSKNSVDMNIIFTAIGVIVAEKAIELLLTEIKDHLKNKWKGRQIRKRKI